MDKTNKFNAKITGVFFILAAVSSVIGLKLYDPILANSTLMLTASDFYPQIIFGSINEMILAVSATGTGLMLFPFLKCYDESIALGYLSFRLLEVVFIMIGTVSILTALSISGYYESGSIKNEDDATNLMFAFVGVHKWTFILGPNFMLAINTALYSAIFLKTKAIPRNLSKLGILASLLIMTAAILELFGIIEQISTWGILLAVPIAMFEMTLAVWFIFKGIKSPPQKTRTQGVAL